MTRSFAEDLAEAVRTKGCPLVVGLDPRPDRLPRELTRSAPVTRAIVEFHRRLLDVVAPLVPCVKPQSAFYEALGHEGVRAYEETCALAHERGLLVIGDVKRGDVGATAEAYAAAHLGLADAVTVNPLLGTDSLEPFLARCRDAGKGLFVLVRTSNPSAREFQDLRCDGRTLSEHLADAVDRWGRSVGPDAVYSSVGAVVGATFPAELATLRRHMPRAWILLPGVGPQGGRIEDLAPAFDALGRGGLVSASRAVTECFDPTDSGWELRVREVVTGLRATTSELTG